MVSSRPETAHAEHVDLVYGRMRDDLIPVGVCTGAACGLDEARGAPYTTVHNVLINVDSFHNG